jgi:AraC-like DNA-binding protein
VASHLRSFILYVCTLGALRRTVKWQEQLIGVILHQLQAVRMVPLQLPHLSDPRVARISDILVREPGDARTLAQLCRVVGASKRSIERLFRQETGMTFGKWRQQLRLMQGMRLLAEGAKVTHAALEAGYSTPSAFISMFRKTLGTTLTSYFRLR